MALSQFIRAAKSDAGIDLWITGTIGEDVRFAELRATLEFYSGEGQAITLNIYSHGGMLDDATAFYDWTKAAGITFNVRVWGTAMSAATVLAAAAGRDNIEMAAHATWMIHEAWGGTPEMITNGNNSMVKIYRALSGQSEKKIREMMAATTDLSADQAVEMGFAGKVMKGTMKLAAMYDAAPIELKDKTTAMADEKKKITVKAELKIGTMEAFRKAFNGEATTVDVEVDVDAATAQQIADRDTTIKNLEAKIAEMEAAPAKEVEVIKEVKVEDVEAKAELETVKAQVKDLQAQLDKKPLAAPVIANNAETVPGATPHPTESDRAAQRFVKASATALDDGLANAKKNTKKVKS
jgi:ATP-dependent Clp protease, protease subunit